jgi:YVTN family beta-propeller protein
MCAPQPEMLEPSGQPLRPGSFDLMAASLPYQSALLGVLHLLYFSSQGIINWPKFHRPSLRVRVRKTLTQVLLCGLCVATPQQPQHMIFQFTRIQFTRIQFTKFQHTRFQKNPRKEDALSMNARILMPAIVVLLVMGALLSAFNPTRVGKPELELGTAIQVGAEPVGLALANDGSRLYVANAANHSLSIVTILEGGGSVVNIPLGLPNAKERLNSVALSPDAQTAFVTEVEKGRVYAVDLKASRVKGVAQTGSFPQGIVVSSDGRYVYTADTGSNSVTEIDTRTLKRSRSIAVSERPHSLAFGPTTAGSATLLVSTFVHSIDRIDLMSGKTLPPYDLGELARFQGLEVTRDGHVFVADGLSDSVQEFNPDGTTRGLNPGDVLKGKEFSPTDVALSVDGSRLYVVGRDGRLGVIDTTSGKLIQSLELGGDLRQVVVSQDGRVYATDTAGNRVVTAVPVTQK